jgi:hypothetical protein
VSAVFCFVDKGSDDNLIYANNLTVQLMLMYSLRTLLLELSDPFYG